MINELLKERGLNSSRNSKEVFEVYNILKENGKSIDKFIGGLSVICSGEINEKIRLSFSLINTNEDQLDIKSLSTYLFPIYQLKFHKSKIPMKEANITPEELARMTSQQCLCDYNKKTIAIKEFVAWFTSQARTLGSKCEESDKDN